jgi:hypothetical protein
MVDRSNVFLVFPQEEDALQVHGLYLYSPVGAVEFCTTALSEALDKGYTNLADISAAFTSLMFKGIVDQVNYTPDGTPEDTIAVVDIENGEISFAPEGLEHDRDSWYSTLSYPEFVAAHNG